MATRNIESGKRMSATDAAERAADTLVTSRRHYLVGLAAAGLTGLGLAVAPAEVAPAFEVAGGLLTVAAAGGVYCAEKRTYDLTRPHRKVLSETGSVPDLPSYSPSKMLATDAAVGVIFVGIGTYVGSASYQQAMHGLPFGERALNAMATGSALGIGLAAAGIAVAVNIAMERELRQFKSPEVPNIPAE